MRNETRNTSDYKLDELLHVELPNKRSVVGVLEVFWKHSRGKLRYVMDHDSIAISGPEHACVGTSIPVTRQLTGLHWRGEGMSSVGPPSAVRRKFGIAENFDSFGDESWHATLAFGGTTCLQGPGCVREVMSVRAGVKLRQVSGGGPTGLHKHLLARISRTIHNNPSPLSDSPRRGCDALNYLRASHLFVV